MRDAILAALNLNIFARHADRVRMANIAQMINVLQAMILTDKSKMVLTPTYYVFKMYVPFQDATFVPVTFDAGTYTHGDITLPRVDAIAARDATGKLWLEITNLDPNQAAEIEANLGGITAKSAAGETLTAPKVDSVNTFEAPKYGRTKSHFREDRRRQAHSEAGTEVGNRNLTGTMTEFSQTALVTGASRGIGKEIAIELARNHYRVAVNYFNDPAWRWSKLRSPKSALCKLPGTMTSSPFKPTSAPARRSHAMFEK